MTEKKNGNGDSSAKAFGGIVAIIAVVAGVYAMVSPMSQRIDYLQKNVEHHITLSAKEISNIRKTTAEHDAKDNEREAAILARLARKKEKFVEVDIRFLEVKDRITNLEDWLKEWQRVNPKIGDAIRSEKIRQLEKTIDRIILYIDSEMKDKAERKPNKGRP